MLGRFGRGAFEVHLHVEIGHCVSMQSWTGVVLADHAIGGKLHVRIESARAQDLLVEALRRVGKTRQYWSSPARVIH